MKKNQPRLSQNKSPKKLPHITRIFTASFIIRSWTILIIALIISINIASSWLRPLSSEELFRQAVIRNPFSASLHQELGRIFLTKNKNFAVRELGLAVSLAGETKSRVLGLSLSPAVVLGREKAAEENLQNSITFWQQFLVSQPDYRYGYLKLASLYNRLGENEIARQYLLLAVNKFPTDQNTNDLLGKLQ